MIDIFITCQDGTIANLAGVERVSWKFEVPTVSILLHYPGSGPSVTLCAIQGVGSPAEAGALALAVLEEIWRQIPTENKALLSLALKEAGRALSEALEREGRADLAFVFEQMPDPFHVAELAEYGTCIVKPDGDHSIVVLWHENLESLVGELKGLGHDTEITTVGQVLGLRIATDELPDLLRTLGLDDL